MRSCCTLGINFNLIPGADFTESFKNGAARNQTAGRTTKLNRYGVYDTDWRRSGYGLAFSTVYCLENAQNFC